MAQLIGIRVLVLPDNDQQAARVIEAISNVLVGLAMEGISGEIEINPYNHEPAEPDV
jgi:hypothetical protein